MKGLYGHKDVNRGQSHAWLRRELRLLLKGLDGHKDVRYTHNYLT